MTAERPEPLPDATVNTQWWAEADLAPATLPATPQYTTYTYRFDTPEQHNHRMCVNCVVEVYMNYHNPLGETHYRGQRLLSDFTWNGDLTCPCCRCGATLTPNTGYMRSRERPLYCGGVGYWDRDENFPRDVIEAVLQPGDEIPDGAPRPDHDYDEEEYDEDGWDGRDDDDLDALGQPQPQP